VTVGVAAPRGTIDIVATEDSSGLGRLEATRELTARAAERADIASTCSIERRGESEVTIAPACAAVGIGDIGAIDGETLVGDPIAVIVESIADLDVVGEIAARPARKPLRELTGLDPEAGRRATVTRDIASADGTKPLTRARAAPARRHTERLSSLEFAGVTVGTTPLLADATSTTRVLRVGATRLRAKASLARPDLEASVAAKSALGIVDAGSAARRRER
jgi:hypothetical protein